MALCTKCGAELYEGQKFCQYCGTPVAAAEMASQVLEAVGETAETVTEAVEEKKDEIQEFAAEQIQEIEEKAEEAVADLGEAVDAGKSEVEEAVADAAAAIDQFPEIADNEIQSVLNEANEVIGSFESQAAPEIAAAAAATGSFVQNNTGSFVQGDTGSFSAQPVQNYQQPVQNYQQPVQNYQQPAQGYQQPVQGYQQPAQGYQQQQYQPNYQYNNAPPVPKKKSGKGGLIAAIIVGLLLIAGVVGFVVIPKLSGGGKGGTAVGFKTYWEGDWYGWWSVHDATGDYVDYEGNWWDACVNIKFTSDDEATITIWDEDASKSDYSGIIYAKGYDDGSESGCLVSKSGYFFGDEIGDGEIYFQVDTSFGYKNLVVIEAEYTDPDDPSAGGFMYYIVIRPWGTDWSDISADDDYLIPYYMDWYNEHRSGPMPDYMDVDY